MKVGSLARALGDGVGGARLTNRATRMAFAGHWTLLLGKIAQYAFVVLVTGVFPTFLFKPSMSSAVVLDTREWGRHVRTAVGRSRRPRHRRQQRYRPTTTRRLARDVRRSPWSPVAATA
jgi:hypothetical protein